MPDQTRPQDVSADKPTTEVDEENEPTTHGRADDDSDVRDDDGDTDLPA
ncbi:hypothetical protein [Rubrivirga sp. IMCC45206]